MANSPLLLGIDLGTTTCRAVAFDLSGNVAAAAAHETEIDHPQPWWAEVPPERWWDGVARAVRQVVEEVGQERIAAVGPTGLMHAPVLLDEAGESVFPSMLWLDQRCVAQREALARELAAAGRAVRIGTTHVAPRLRWLFDERPDVLARVQTLLLPKDYVRFRLADDRATDPSDAGGTGLLDRASGEWDAAMVEMSRLPERALPPIVAAETHVGGVTARAAAETGLREGTPVATGASDVTCTRLGAGPLLEGEAIVYLGTATWMALRDPTPGAPPDRVRHIGSTTATGAALRWARDLFAESDERTDYEALMREAARVPPGARGVICLPHLMGERGPMDDPFARGALVGLTLAHRRGDVLRAVIEGTAFQLRRVLEKRTQEGGAPHRALVCGGAGRSALWRQVIADVTRLPLRIARQAECAAWGAARMAASAAGLEVRATELPAPEVTVTPDEDTACVYDGQYGHYRAVQDALGPVFRGEHVRYETTMR